MLNESHAALKQPRPGSWRSQMKRESRKPLSGNRWLKPKLSMEKHRELQNGFDARLVAGKPESLTAYSRFAGAASPP
jgi:hypothetical protein